MTSQAIAMRETERKYEFQPNAQPLDPSGLLGPIGHESALQHLEAVYYDTADLRLLRAGITLRRREGGHDAGWHAKFPVDADNRQEIRLPLDEPDVPAEFVSLTRLPARGRSLIPVARLTTTRRRWVLSDEQERELAEVVEDRVDARRLGPRSSRMQWCEFEVELGEHGRPELLDRIERRLLEAGARRAAAPSKLARVLGDRLEDTGDDRGPRPGKRLRRGSAGAVLMDYLQERGEQIRCHDLGVRRDAPDAVHRMRVGAREMRSALQGFGRVLDRAATRPLTEELKWLGAQLAPARDSEVLAEQLTECVASLPAELVLGPVNAQVQLEMARRAHAGRDRALAALDSDRYLKLHQMIDALLAEPPWTPRAARPARTELSKSVAKAYRRSARRVEVALALDAGAERDLAMHEARKAAKRLRYAVELSAPVLGRGARVVRRSLKRVHELLGAHQDSVVARPVLRELAVAAHLDGADGFTYGLLHAEQARRAADAARDLPAVWRELSERISHRPLRIRPRPHGKRR
jgi:CHAD domain-containing protein